MNYNKYIYLLIILILAVVSNYVLHNKEKFENINTLNLNESQFYPEACGSTISFSGSLGCPQLTNSQLNELLSRGGNNSKLI